jgi:hypothetical protein
MNVHLLEQMVVFVAARLVNMKKRGFDESYQQGTSHPYCTEGSQRPPDYATSRLPVNPSRKSCSIDSAVLCHGNATAVERAGGCRQ